MLGFTAHNMFILPVYLHVWRMSGLRTLATLWILLYRLEE